ncbi:MULTISPECIES: hypothetical protein [unclassified Streptomyces]|uniref:hypothetical protein n=1 Tax=unclassified Streptomyces TaxID=2593676 RepID=UPI0022AF1EC8|nr:MULTISPECIES: hypothetical protein [unclassified Streptomyces]MCZ4097318.1 hypothetical protein [Streptomyces sp. H39-C1]MCZ4120622.1 hypothetical protein [Streptomyces sp. H39-S7]
MTDTTITPASAQASSAAVTDPAGTPVDVAPALDPSALQAEVEKWKGLSRKNEASFKAASKELDQFRQVSMSDQERALEQARTETRTAVLSEVGERLAAAELRAQAASAGATLPDADFLNLSRFVSEDGSPDPAAVKAFVSTLPTAKKAPVYAQGLGLGRQGSSTAGQISRSDLARMTTAQINTARDKGLLDAVMRGEI